jgi:hypothetical protein
VVSYMCACDPADPPIADVRRSPKIDAMGAGRMTDAAGARHSSNLNCPGEAGSYLSYHGHRFLSYLLTHGLD